MSLKNPLPMTNGDLRHLADALDEIESYPLLAANKAIGRIEAHLDGDDNVVGHFTRLDESDPEMGWGFEASK